MEENSEAKIRTLETEVKRLKRTLVILGYFFILFGIFDAGYAFSAREDSSRGLWYQSGGTKQVGYSNSERKPTPEK